MSKYLFLGIAIFSAAFSNVAFSAWQTTDSVQISLISSRADDGSVLIQTRPRHNINQVSCESDYWMVLYKNDPGYQAVLAQLLSAQATKAIVNVVAMDGPDPKFCNLFRLTTSE